MSDENGHDRLLQDARKRGQQLFGSKTLPIDSVTACLGLLASAVELGHLIATEERDLTVITNHHDMEKARLIAAFKEAEAAMQGDFERDAANRENAFAAINALIAQQQFELATRWYEMLMNTNQRPTLELVLESRNAAAAGSNTRITLK